MKLDDFEKRSERFQLRVTPNTKSRISILAQGEGMSMSSFIERLVNAAWDEQCKIQGFDFSSSGFPWKICE